MLVVGFVGLVVWRMFVLEGEGNTKDAGCESYKDNVDCYLHNQEYKTRVDAAVEDAYRRAGNQ